MPHRKVDTINDAYSRLRIGGITVQPSPEDLELALMRLEQLLAELEGARNVCLGYHFEEEPDPNSVSNLPRWAHNGVALGLAVQLIPDFNKEVPAALYRAASAAMSALSSRSAADRVRRVQYPDRQPVGSGNRHYPRWARFFRPLAEAPNDCDTQQIQAGETLGFSVSFASELQESELLQSYTVSASSGLTVSNDAVVGSGIDYTVAAASGASGWKTITFTVTTDAGRVLVRVVNVEVCEPVEVR